MRDNPFMTKAEQPGTGKMFVDILQAIILALVVNVVIYFLFVVPSQVDGPSMLPNLHDKDLLFADKVIQWLGQTQIGASLDYNYKRGDIIIFDEAEISLVKRIIAAPGDTIKFENDKIYVNDKVITEKYISAGVPTHLPSGNLAFLAEGEALKIPDNYYFVMGDNRTNSKDSRFKDIGLIPRERIKGRVFIRFWPLEKFGLIQRGDYTEQ